MKYHCHTYRYHIATSWSFFEGLSLYINGQFKDRDRSPSMRSPESVTEDYSEFFIGKKNDDTSSKPPLHSNKTILVDEFNFWSEYKTADQIKELGLYIWNHVTMGTIDPTTLYSDSCHANCGMLQVHLHTSICPWI